MAGTARRRKVWSGAKWRGPAMQCRHGEVWTGWSGEARRGTAGEVRRGAVRLGKAGQCNAGKVRQVRERSGAACFGKATQVWIGAALQGSTRHCRRR